jgi:hypothetical protein
VCVGNQVGCVFRACGHANRLASLPGMAMVNSYLAMKTRSADTT